MRSGPVCNSHRVTHFTLCPLGEPEIAIGHEPRIEPWLTHSTTTSLSLSQLADNATSKQETYEIQRQNPCSEADEKWAGSRETKPRLRSRQIFFLDILISTIGIRSTIQIESAKKNNE